MAEKLRTRETMSDEVEAIDFMLKQFRVERYAYLGVTIASFILLFICIIIFMSKNPPVKSENLAPVIGMLGSGGVVAFTASQLLRMWRDCMELFTNTKKKKDSE